MGLRNTLTAMVLAVTVAGVISGCCMKRDIVIVDDKINKIRHDQRIMKEDIARLDSLLTSETDASLKLRAEIRNSVNELMELFRTMQVNINDLQVVVSRLSDREGTGFPVISTVTGADSGRDTSSAAAVIPGIDCQGLYDESFINLRRGQYEEAIQGFTDYLRYCGEQDLADNARFWIGESYYSTDMYKEAITEFDLLLKNYPQSEKRPGALYKKARSLEELGQKQDAKKTFQKLVDEFPGTLEAEQAKEKLKELD